ncbi:MAG: MFS transporter [Syntrophomonadaceae bacterium]|jgi:GPH family glycoside/pentoside/hexuronide:cation symporter
MKQRLSNTVKFIYGTGDIASNLVWTTVGSFLTMYYTDVALISAATVGTLMIVSRILDGITDLTMGWVIDRTRSRLGKARPWLIISAPLLCALLVMLFSVPSGFETSAKVVYASITYILICAVAYTASNLSYSIMCNFMTRNIEERNQMNAIRFIMAFLTQIFVNSYTVIWVDKLGGGSQGWTRLMVIYAAIAIVIFAVVFAFCKEDPDIIAEQNADEKVKIPLQDIWHGLMKGKNYMILALGIYVCFYMQLILMNSSMVFFARDVLGKKEMTISLTMFMLIPSLILLPFVPALARRFGVHRTLSIGYLFGIIGPGIVWFGNGNLTMILIGRVLYGINQALVAPLVQTKVSQMADYNCLINDNMPLVGVTNSVTSFGVKIGVGMGGALVGWLLEVGQYQANAAVQSPSALAMENALFSIIPCVFGVICFLLNMGWDIGKALDQAKRDRKLY